MNTEKTQSPPWVSFYNERPVLNIMLGTGTFAFGIIKAKAILANLETVKEFVNTYDLEEVEDKVVEPMNNE